MAQNVVSSKVFISLLSDFKTITKMGLSLSVVFSCLAGYLLAADTINYSVLSLLAVGGYCMVGASNVFNQIIEKSLYQYSYMVNRRSLELNPKLVYLSLLASNKVLN